MDEKYLQQYEQFKQKALRLHAQNDQVKAGIRRDVDAVPEEREDRYIRSYQQINEEFDRAGGEHAAKVERMRSELERTVYGNDSRKFAEHLTSLVGVPDEKLPELMAAARRSGQADLEQAVALTAWERKKLGIFNEWAEAHPEKGEAYRRLHSIPDMGRVLDRTMALRPFKADIKGLTPTQEDRERVAGQNAADEARKAAFFNRPRRQVGGRIA